MKIKFLLKALLVQICIISTLQVRASLNNYNFTQQVDTISPLIGGTNLVAYYHNTTVYYGAANQPYGTTNANNLFFSGIPIGFNFIVDGQVNTVFGINSRGYLMLGNNSLNMKVTPATNPISGKVSATVISALGGYLCQTNASRIHYSTLGTAPNRILAVQFDNMARRYSMNNDSLSFQIRLYEGTNKIQFIYHKLSVLKQGADQYFEIGIRGIDSSNYSNRPLTGNWENSSWGFTNKSTCMLGKYNYPALGTSFTFSPPDTACIASNLSGTIFPSSYAVSATDTFTLILDAVNLAANTSIEWQKSIDSVNYTPLPSLATRFTFLSQDSTAFYRCKLSCGTTNYFTNNLKITQLYNMQTYCSSYSRYSNAINIGQVKFSNLLNGNAVPALSSQVFNAFTDYCNVAPAVVNQGANYELSVKEIFHVNYIKSGVMVFIDYNKDGVFDNTTETIFLGKTKSGVNGYEARSFIQIPDSAPLGLTKMRIVLYDPNTQLPVEPCDATFYGETEDYLVQIMPAQPCTSVPDTLYTGASVTEVCSTVSFRIFVASALGSGYTFQWFVSTDSLNWASIPGATSNAYFLSQNQQSFYKCLVTCSGADSVYTLPLRVGSSPFYLCYCDFKAINPSLYQIKNVNLSTLDNTSGSKQKLYSNYTSITPAPLVKGGKYNFSVTYEAEYYKSTMLIKAYIDYDRNGVFGNKANEIISLGALAFSSQLSNTKSILLSVPDSANIGITGLRIAYWEVNSNSSNNGCGSFNHGEVEDYLVNIMDADSCVSPVLPGFALAKETMICKGKAAHLSLGGINYSPNYLYQWQSSIDSLNWNSVAGQTLFTASIVQSVKTYYRCKVSCADSFSFSKIVVVDVAPFINCYCSSAAYPDDFTDIGNIQLAGVSYGSDTLATNTYGGNTYRDFTDSLAPITLEQDGNYTMKIIAAKTNRSTNYIKAFVCIDYNQNGAFESSEIVSTGPFTTTAVSRVSFNVMVPDTAILGITRMRVVLLDGNASTNNFLPCGNYYNYGETADYLVSIIPTLPCVPFTLGNPVFNDTTFCLNSLLLMSMPGVAPQTALKYKWQKSLDAQTWTTLNYSATNNFQDTIKGAFYYRCIVSCGTFADTSNTQLVNLRPLYLCHCTSFAINGSYVDIGNIKIAGYNYGGDTLVNSTVSNIYTDYTNTLPPIVLQRGGFYPITITASKSTTYSSNPNASVYIDFNQNGQFDANEKFVTGIFTGTFPHKGFTNIDVPATALTGISRMRVVLNAPYYKYPLGPSACGIYYGYGETEDYLVNIINPIPCDPIVHGTISTPAIFPVCTNQQITLSYSNGSNSPLYDFEWQSSTDSINWTVLSNQTTQSLNVTLTNQKYFRCILTCSPFSDTSNCLTITYNSFYNCYCTSYASIAGLSDIGNIKLAGYNYGGDTLANPILNNTYTDFTTTLSPIVLEQGAHYPMQVTAALSNFSIGFNTLATVYIDFNHNAIFDANEFSVVKNFNNYFPSVGNGILQLPANAMLGLTRMRIILSTGPQNLNNSLPCSAFKYYGETEDYLVSIVPPTPCPMLNHGYIATNSTTICPTEKFVLTYVGNPNLIQSNYRWQTSSDSSNWTNISGTFYEVYSSLLSVAAYYRCIVTCGSSADTTHAIYLQKKPFETCYCTSAALDSGIVDIGFIQLGDFKNGNDTLPLNPNANRTYSDFTGSLAPIQLNINTKDYMIIQPAFTIDTVVNVKATISIDLNHDGSFNSTGNETTLIDNFQLRYPFTGFVALNTYYALPGITRMRIKLVAGSDLNATTSFCDNYVYGETQDYLVNLVSANSVCAPLIKGKVKAAQKFTCSSNGRENIFYYIGNPYHNNMLYKWQHSSDSISWYSNFYPVATNPFLILQNMSPSMKYLRCIATCGTYKDTSTVLKVNFGKRNDCYCKFWEQNPTNQDIGNVSLLSLSNGNAQPFVNNALAINRHSDFTNLPAVELKQGFIYPLTVTQINQGAFRDAKISCFIDFDANGYIDPIEECVIGYTSDTSTVPGRVTGNISIPYNADTSVVLMRVAMAEKTNNTKLYPCGISSQPSTGEAEDYLVKIVPNTNCVQPVAGNAYAPINRYCQYDSVYLQLKNYSLINGQSYQWQFSFDGNLWYNAGAKLNYPIRILQIKNPTYYRCIVSCNSLQDTSTSVFIGMLPSSACYYCGSSTSPYPLGGSECFWNDKIIHVKLQGTALDNADTNCYKINNSFSYTFPDVGNTTALIGRGKTYKLFVTTSKTTNVSAWIDFNNDRVFSASEWFNVSDTSQAYVPDSITFTVPQNATLGNTRMRIRSRYAQNQNDNNDACSYFFSGETEDYVLRIDLASNTEVLSQNFDVSIEPNPANEFINVTVHSVESDKYQIQLLNMQGQLVYFGDLKKEESVYRSNINVQNFAKGIYTLQLKSRNNTINRKVVIQ